MSKTRQMTSLKKPSYYIDIKASNIENAITSMVTVNHIYEEHLLVLFKNKNFDFAVHGVLVLHILHAIILGSNNRNSDSFDKSIFPEDKLALQAKALICQFLELDKDKISLKSKHSSYTPLAGAVSMMHVELIKLYIRNGANPNEMYDINYHLKMKDSTVKSKFDYILNAWSDRIIESHDDLAIELEILEAIIKTPSLDSKSSLVNKKLGAAGTQRNIPLVRACEKDQVNILDLLLNNGFSAACDNLDESLVQVCLKNKSMKCLDQLVYRSLTPNKDVKLITNEDVALIFKFCIEGNDARSLKKYHDYLIRANFNIDSLFSESILTYCIKYDADACLYNILHLGSKKLENINIQLTMLVNNAITNKKNKCRDLLREIDLMLVDSDGETALHRALRMRAFPTLQYHVLMLFVLPCKQSFNLSWGVRTKRNDNLLHYAVNSGDDAVELLLKKLKAPIATYAGKRNNANQTAFESAIEKRMSASVELMLELGYQPDEKERLRYTEYQQSLMVKDKKDDKNQAEMLKAPNEIKKKRKTNKAKLKKSMQMFAQEESAQIVKDVSQEQTHKLHLFERNNYQRWIAHFSDCDKKGIKDSDIIKVFCSDFGISCLYAHPKVGEIKNLFTDAYYAQNTKDLKFTNRGIYIVGSTVLNLMLKRHKIIANDLDLLLVGISTGDIESMASKRNIKYRSNIHFGNTDKVIQNSVTLYSDDEINAVDVVCVDPKRFEQSFKERDFTVSGIYLNIISNELVAPYGYFKDLILHRKIRIIDEDSKRVHEEFALKLRGVRLAHKLKGVGITFDDGTAHEIQDVSSKLGAQVLAKEQAKGLNTIGFKDVFFTAESKILVEQTLSQLKKVLFKLGIQESYAYLKENNLLNQLIAPKEILEYLFMSSKPRFKAEETEKLYDIHIKALFASLQQSDDTGQWVLQQTDKLNDFISSLSDERVKNSQYYKLGISFLATLLMLHLLPESLFNVTEKLEQINPNNNMD